MPRSASVEQVNGRPVLVIDGQVTTELWCFANAAGAADFVAGDCRICEFPLNVQHAWWRGIGAYDFTRAEQEVDALLAVSADLLLVPRLMFGFMGEQWYRDLHPDELSIARSSAGDTLNYADEGAHYVEVWQSAGAAQWLGDAATALAAFVQHFEQRNGARIIGYHIGGGISTEWFRWWNFVEEAYEDYSTPAVVAFRAFLKERYCDNARLQQAWRRADVTLDNATVPEPERQHTPRLGYFRHPTEERDVVDWLECLSMLNITQALGLCAAAKAACQRQKLTGTFFGYYWPHWNTRSPARFGHIGLHRLLSSPDVDFICSPYHYDNRRAGGFHHSQTVPQAIERAGKLHVDEIDNPTHLRNRNKPVCDLPGLPESPAASCRTLVRDAAAVLGTAGTAWWMDLQLDRWYADATIQRTLREMQALARQTAEWSSESQAEIALVVDDASSAWCDLNSSLSQYFTALSRQFEWGDLGFPVDTLMLDEVADVRPYKVYLMLNAWHLAGRRRAAVLDQVRQSGATAVWFYGGGYYDTDRHGAVAVSEAVGMSVVEDPTATFLELETVSGAHPLLTEAGDPPRGQKRFGTILEPERRARLLAMGPKGLDDPAAPRFIVDDDDATPLGRYLQDERIGLASVERDGWRSVYCGVPMMPGWLVRRIALQAGVHPYTGMGYAVHQRGPLVCVYAPQGGRPTVVAPADRDITQLACGPDGRWGPRGDVGPELSVSLLAEETAFFYCA